MKNRIKYFFLSLKIKKKFMLGMLLIILILSSCIGKLTFNASKELIKRNTIELTTELLNQYAENIYNKTEALRETAFQASKEFVKNNSLDNNMYIRDIEVLINRRLNDMVSQYRSSSNDYIEAVCVTGNDGYFYWGHKDNVNKYYIDNDYIRKTILLLKNQEESSFWMPTENNETIIFVSKMVSPDTLISHGYIILFINKDYFLTLDNKTSSISNDQIAIIKGNNEVLIKDDILGKEEILQDINSRKERIFSIEDNGVKYSAVSTKIQNKNWKVISIISEKKLLSNINHLRTIITLVCIVISMLALIIAYIIAGGVTKNIRLLEKNMQKVEDGNFNVRVKPSTYDEVGLLSLRFNYMMKKINELINTVYVERIKKQEAEFEVLKAQINPHFLYNTLGSVKWLSRMQGEKKIEDMVDSLIYILRVSIKGDKYITINDELLYINKYIDLQKIRFEDRFRMVYNIDTDIMNCYVLQFILQPIVENAIYHGLEISKGNGIITINGFKKDESIILEVIDNGVGMTEEQYNKIISDDNTKYSGLNSIGIANVDKRIKMYFGTSNGITIKSELGKGTTVSITLPYIENRYDLDD
ncbi:sensor histidine kinase [Vallitalea guaymasensis]|uniref:histidine kinase n=1 Tax=Vallitalea guaymasensis TaxID=1185412 RepID=A0A8J8MEM5_9FIRM|nr:sensor histidine kinase [Vallitalea guaymasensis]QUH31512.1 sensor histidine kinase [Vallitalea guaymasensis]